MAGIKTSPSIDTIAAECVGVRVRMLNRVVTNIYDEALRSLGVKMSQMNILVATAKLGTVQPADICLRLQLDASTLSRNVERMKSRGWLEVVPHSDARSQPFRLTPAGRKLLQKAAPLWQQAQKRVKAELGKELVALLTQATGTHGAKGQ